MDEVSRSDLSFLTSLLKDLTIEQDAVSTPFRLVELYEQIAAMRSFVIDQAEQAFEEQQLQQVHACERFYGQPRYAIPEDTRTNLYKMLETLHNFQQEVDRVAAKWREDMVRKEEERQADDERWQVQEQVVEETQPEDSLSNQTDQTELVALDIIDFMSQDVFYVNQNDMLNDDPCRKESQKEPELKETDCCIQQVDCSHVQNEQKQIAPLQLGAQISLAQTRTATFRLPNFTTFWKPNFTTIRPPNLSLQLPLQHLQPSVQKEEAESNSAIPPSQKAHAHNEQEEIQDPKPKEHVDLCLPKPPDKVEFVLPEFSTKLQLPMEKYELEFKVLPNHLKNANIRARGTPHLKEEKLIMLLHEYMEKVGWAMTKSQGVLHFLLNAVGTLFPSPIT